MDSEPTEHVVIPFSRLSADAQLGIIDDFVLREGTDYGDEEATLDAKRRQLRAQIDAGHVIVVFDPDTDSCTLRNAR